MKLSLRFSRSNLASGTAGVLAMCANPVLGVVAGTMSLAFKKRPSWLALAISFALIYAYLPPLWDARNNFYELSNPSGPFRDNLYLWVLSALQEFLHVEYMAAVSIIGFFIIFIHFRIIGSRALKLPDYGSYLFVVVIIFATIEYQYTFGLQRSALAGALFVAGLASRSPAVTGLLIALSVTVHSQTALPAIAYVGATVMPIRLQSRTLPSLLIVAVVFALFMSPSLLSEVSSQISFLPNRVAMYLARPNDRYSSQTVGGLVWALRTVACIMVAAGCIINLRRMDEAQLSRRLVCLLAYVAIFTIAVSRNEILLERYFLMVVVMSAFVLSTVAFPRMLLAPMVVALLANTVVHGVYAQYVIHAVKYEVIESSSFRQAMTTQALTSPTLTLLDYADRGYSNELMLKAISPALRAK